jgi:hypothetical protein
MQHGLGHHREALELLDRAAVLRPDLEALPAKRGQVQEALGLYADAARSWRLYAEMEQASEPIAEARDRHVRLALDRARRLEEKAVAP